MSNEKIGGWNAAARIGAAWIAALATGLLASPVGAKDSAVAIDSNITRLELYARMQTLNSEILGNRSATMVLERWCAEHRLADVPVVLAVRVKAEPMAPSAQTLERLRVDDSSALKFRRVELRCGEVVLSKADNWYVPARLTDAMNAQLDGSDTPFGKVVAPLEPFRQTIESELLWRPLADAKDCSKSNLYHMESVDIPTEIFRHRAVLYTREMQPFSEVSEVYQGAALRFPLETCESES